MHNNKLLSFSNKNYVYELKETVIKFPLGKGPITPK